MLISLLSLLTQVYINWMNFFINLLFPLLLLLFLNISIYRDGYLRERPCGLRSPLIGVLSKCLNEN